MITIGREELKEDFPDLIADIQKKHVMEPNIYDELFVRNKPVKGLCHQRGYFVIVGDMFIQYVMDHIIVNPDLQLIGRSLQQVIVYDDYQEYERERLLKFNSVKPQDQTGINFN
jgi:hypothetical protein